MDNPLEVAAWSVWREGSDGSTVVYRCELFTEAVAHLADVVGGEALESAPVCRRDADVASCWFVRWALDAGGWEALVKTTTGVVAHISFSDSGVERLGEWTDVAQAVRVITFDD